MYKRILDLRLSSEETCFLWGPRQTGKSTLLKALFPKAVRFDLLKSDVCSRLLANPALVREECAAGELTGETQRDPIIIDEVQKVPPLLDEVHWMIENKGLRFILCGSSARKVKRGRANLLGGRAVRYELHPLVSSEIPEFSLQTALNAGLVPRHYDSGHSSALLESYVGDYLTHEIAEEALTRNIPAFSSFLNAAALTNGELVNYRNIAMECGVSAPTVKNYFQILEDTLLGRFLPAFRKRTKRRQIRAPKFYFFDVGLVAHLSRRGAVEQGSELFGRAFEHFVFMELTAYRSYSDAQYHMTYWRTSSGFEVDFLLDDNVAIEVKSSSMVRNQHLRGIRAFREEVQCPRCIVLSLDARPRKTSDGIEIMPWRMFLERLWGGEII